MSRRSREYATTRCVDGRLMRHDPMPDDPYLETDIGKCPECEGKGCAECDCCGPALRSGNGAAGIRARRERHWRLVLRSLRHLRSRMGI